VFAQKTTLKQAVDIIADPAVDEKKWLAACTVVGDQKIALNQQCPVKRTGLSLTNGFFAMLIAANMIGVFLGANFLSANLAWLMSGQDINFFMEQTWIAGYLAFPATIGAALSLWLSIGLRAQQTLRRIILSGLSLAPVLLLVLGVVWMSPWTTAFAGSLALGTLVGALLGRAFNNGLPSSFPLNRTIAANAGGACLLGSVMLWVIVQAFTRAHDAHSSYADPSMSAVFGMASILGFATFVPAACSTLAMKSKVPIAAVGMNLLLQSPVFLGLFILPVAFSLMWAVLSINPAALGTFMHLHGRFELSALLAPNAAGVFLSLLVPPVVAAGSIGAGSMYGVWCNRKADERQQKQKNYRD
jgi:hypothetical protein